MENISYIPIEMWQEISSHLNFISNIKLKRVCKRFEFLKIYNLNSNETSCFKKLDDNIIQRYPFIKNLSVNQNPNITNLNHLKNSLQILHCSSYPGLGNWFSGINDYGIKDLDLFELYANNNVSIKNINHFNNLRILHAVGECGIEDYSIRNLNLIELDASSNPKITSVNHMSKLKILLANNYCGIDDNGIKQCMNLIRLEINWNSKITDLNHLTNLQILFADSDACNLGDEGIAHLRNLIHLTAFGNRRLKNINHLTKLQILNAGIEMGYDDIKDLNLIELYTYNIEQIKEKPNMTNLKKFIAYDCC